MANYEYAVVDSSGVDTGQSLIIFPCNSFGGDWGMEIPDTDYRSCGYETLDEALSYFKMHKPNLNVIVKSRYERKMETLIPDDGTFRNYRQYYNTMDAIYSRHPERMTPNGMTMLEAKMLIIEDIPLKLDAQKAFDNLVRESGVYPEAI